MFQPLRVARTLVRLLLRRPLVGTSIIPIQADGRIVLVQRRDNLLWALPGGLVDWGETVVEAAARELLEETGLRLERVQRLVGVYSSVDRDPRMHSVCVAVVAEVSGEFCIQDTAEIVDIKGFSPEDLPQPLAHDHQQHLDDYFGDRTTLN